MPRVTFTPQIAKALLQRAEESLARMPPSDGKRATVTAAARRDAAGRLWTAARSAGAAVLTCAHGNKAARGQHNVPMALHRLAAQSSGKVQRDLSDLSSDLFRLQQTVHGACNYAGDAAECSDAALRLDAVTVKRTVEMAKMLCEIVPRVMPLPRS